MSVPPDQAEADAFLRALSGSAPVETHMSLVYVGKDTVWKLKKAVRLGFLDFSMTDSRRHFIGRELALNQAARGLPLFTSMRALVRAHVEAARGQPDMAAAYLDRAHAALRRHPAPIVAIGGLPGSGKSTLARALAPELGNTPEALVLRSDEVRKRRFGVAPEERLPESAYAEDVDMAVFAELTSAAEVTARGGHAVIADATFLRPATRDAIAGAVRTAGVPFVGLWLRAPMDVLESRIAARSGDASDASVCASRRGGGRRGRRRLARDRGCGRRGGAGAGPCYHRVCFVTKERSWKSARSSCP